jgi:hypothetical protein
MEVPGLKPGAMLESPGINPGASFVTIDQPVGSHFSFLTSLLSNKLAGRF